MKYIDRVLEPIIQKSLTTMPAVFVNGPRQSGKSTLIKHIISNKHEDVTYITFDDITAMSAAQNDPEGFLRGFSKLVVIDEVQLVPEIFRAIKLLIDEYRLKGILHANGRFLLTGSANIMALPNLSDALVGRMSINTLYPFSAMEVANSSISKIGLFFDKNIVLQNVFGKSPYPLSEIMLNATFPEVKSGLDRVKWFHDYITTLLQRDIRNLAQIEKIAELPNMLRALAARAGGLLNDASCARDTGLNQMTYRRYRTLLEHLFLITLLPPWFRNIRKRLTKSPKLYFIDTNLLCYVLGVDLITLRKQNPTLFGHILENFVASELTKQLTLQQDYSLYHFHTQDNYEVDFVIESRNGNIVGIEVKATESVTTQDFNGLKVLKESVGEDFIRGIIFYLGDKTISFGGNMIAIPVSLLWSN